MSPPTVPAADPESVAAVVLAGGGADDRLARAASVSAKALVPFGGHPLGAYPAAALRASRRVGRVAWVGPADAATAARVDAHVAAGVRLVDSLALGLGAVAALPGAPPARVVMVSVDAPWLRGDDVDALVAAADGDAEVVYPVVPRAVLEARFPGATRTWVRLRDGAWTGGNLVLADAGAWRRLLPWLDAAGRARKRPWRLAGMVGAGTLLRLVSGRARIEELEAAVGRRVGLRVHAWRTERAGVAEDLDRPEQWRAAIAPALDDAAPTGAAANEEAAT